jgi:hypothetical protein
VGAPALHASIKEQVKRRGVVLGVDGVDNGLMKKPLQLATEEEGVALVDPSR